MPRAMRPHEDAMEGMTGGDIRPGKALRAGVRCLPSFPRSLPPTLVVPSAPPLRAALPFPVSP